MQQLAEIQTHEISLLVWPPLRYKISKKNNNCVDYTTINSHSLLKSPVQYSSFICIDSWFLNPQKITGQINVFMADKNLYVESKLSWLLGVFLVSWMKNPDFVIAKNPDFPVWLNCILHIFSQLKSQFLRASITIFMAEVTIFHG